MKCTVLIQSWLGLCLFVGGLIAQQPTVEVEKVADNVYLYSHNAHRSLFVVTDGGILVTDPQSASAARLYLQEIRKISRAPIRYLVYSHHHDDHVSGGAEFGSDLVRIAHSKLVDHLGSSASSAIAPPHVTFSEKLSVFLDDLEIQLLYPGPSETDDNIIVFVPDRKVAFGVDTVGVRRLPWRNMAGANPSMWMEALKKMAALDFEILAPGHGPTGRKVHLQEYIEYFTDLIQAVKGSMEQGQTLEQIQESLELSAYADWAFYEEFLSLNIEAVHRELSMAR